MEYLIAVASLLFTPLIVGWFYSGQIDPDKFPTYYLRD
jgi:hypothetical protein